MKLQFLGHACFLLDDGVHKVLTDPFLTGAGRPEWAEKVDPDVIFVDFNGLSLINEDYASNPDFYNSLTAVQEGRVYSQISFRYSATNTELALADAYYMGKVLYPEEFADVDMAAKFDEIFETMLGVEDAYAQYQAAGYEFKEMTLGG